MISDGQKLAVEQIARIYSEGPNDIRLIRINPPEKEGASLLVSLKINCAEMQREEGGLPLRSWENFKIYIPPDFPFKKPSTWVPHSRFYGFGHVQWKSYLCLYQAESEWNVSDGMYGYLQRLFEWLILCAINQLDPQGQPIHPPAVYTSSKAKATIIPKEDAPSLDGSLWFGYAHLDCKSERRIDIVGWSHYHDVGVPENVAAVILLPTDLPFEYPTTAKKLFDELLKVGVDQEVLYAIFHSSVAKNPVDTNLYFILGSPMRGTSGSVAEDRKQHLSVWEINSSLVDFLRLESRAKLLELNLDNQDSKDVVKKIAMDCKNDFDKFLSEGLIIWCPVKEDRPEIITRRDQTKRINWFQGKAVALWGCGALGSYVAEILVRAGVSKIVLRDNKTVTPGILVRQNFKDSNIGFSKNSCLRNYLKSINPSLEVVDEYHDISKNFSEIEELEGNIDLIIDATASNALSIKLEKCLKGSSFPEIASMVINHDATKSLLTHIKPENSGLIFDLDRRAKLSSCSDDSELFREAFWPDQGAVESFQPEPGCSDLTFIGSSADLMLMASSMVNQLSKNLSQENPLWDAKVDISAPYDLAAHPKVYRYQSDLVLSGIRGDYEVRVSKHVWHVLKKEIDESDVIGGEVCETGGLLFGHIDDAVKIIWVTEVIGPP